MGEVVNAAATGKIDEVLERAEGLRREKKLAEAKSLLIDALQRNEKPGVVYFRLGNIYHDLKDYDRAEYAYRRAIDHDQYHINAHHNLSVIYRKQGRVTESVKQRKKASKIARQHPDKVSFSDEQITALKGFAKKTLLFAVGVIAVLVALLVWAANLM